MSIYNRGRRVRLPERLLRFWVHDWYRPLLFSVLGTVIIAATIIGSTDSVGTSVEAGLGMMFTGSAYTVRQLPNPLRAGNDNNPRSSHAVPSISIPVVSFVADQRSLGIAAGSSLPSLNDQQLATRLDGIKAAGGHWIRFDFDWSLVQPKSSQSYDWSIYDRIVAAANKRNLAILGLLDYTPAWARQSACSSTSKCAPANPNQFATFAAAAAHRYAPVGIHYWEIWNEPNSHDFWQPTADPGQYVALLRVTYAALHQADVQAHVVTAGLSPQATGNGSYAPYDFLAGMYAHGAHGYFEAVADHPYTFPLSPAADADDAWTQMARPQHSFRSLMIANGDGAKKIWITEFGAPTGGPGPVSTIDNPNLEAHPYVVDEGRQAKLLSDAIALYRTYSWAGPFFYYTYQDPGTDPSTNENFFGLITAAGTHKQAYTVFQAAAAKP